MRVQLNQTIVALALDAGQLLWVIKQVRRRSVQCLVEEQMVGEFASARAQHNLICVGVVLTVPRVLAVEQVDCVLKRLNIAGQCILLANSGLHTSDCTNHLAQVG